jgi:hypothetical protein
MSQPVKRACDACHRRKVKCDGLNPCRNCGTAQLGCTYNAIPQKKGPKGSRAKVISELRETQRQTSLAAKVQNRMQGIPSPPMTPSQLPTPGLVTGEIVKDCLEFFFTHMYAQMPILDRRLVEQQVMYMEQNRDAYCLLTAMCAFTMLQPGKSMPATPGDPFGLDVSPLANITSSALLVEEALRVRKGYDYMDSPDGCVSLNTLATNFFLFACSYGIEMHNKAWYYLREATTMILMGNMHKEETYLKWDPVEAARRRRLYWLFYIAERAYAIQRHRPLTLQATINLPTLNDDPSDPLAHQLSNFILQANIFRPFDDKLTAMWVKTRGALSQRSVSSLQKQLNEVMRSYMCQDPQMTDLHANQQWLKSIVWQLTSCADEFSADVARDVLTNMAASFTESDSMELAGSGLIEKMMDTCQMLADYLAVQPVSRHPFTVGPREHLTQILNIVAVLRNGCNQFLPLLLHKLDGVLPKLADPKLANPPDDSHLANIDIFDGFGNAGMAPLQMALDTDYDRKFSIAEYDKRFSMSGMDTSSESGATPPSSNGSVSVSSGPDLGSQFVTSVGSPAIMSPGVDFGHMNDYACSPITEMVMSPIGGPAPGLGQPPSHHLANLQGHMTPQQIHSHNVMGQSPHSMNGLSPQSIPSSHHISPGAMPGHHHMAPGGGGGDLMSAMARQPQQMPRANSFAMPQAHTPVPIPRTVGDFQALQRTKSETPSMGALAGMASLGQADIDFSNLR